MKIVVLESSPHKNGASNTLAGYFIKGARESEHNVCVLDVADMEICPCKGCYQGKHTGHCILEDDMSAVEKELSVADMIVYVTPVYFYGMSAQLKIVVDRMHCIYPQLKSRGLKSLLLATAWRKDDEVMCYLKNLYTGLADFLNYQNMGAIMAKGCGDTETVRNSHYAEEAYQLGRNL